ncbi:hypothetical protein LJB97_04255 [Parabacteroides sp. OttesenSCG-928-O15]|nr:hypothetical protein [Parabacteroides sp. OttesenSCG-928-O15]
MGILLTLLMFSTPEEIIEGESRMAMSESYIEEKSDAADLQHRFEMISQDMKNSNCLTPRRPIQSTFHIPNVRVIKTATRILHEARIKGAEQIQKISEYRSLCQTTLNSSLFCRWGSHVFSLRKIVI